MNVYKYKNYAEYVKAQKAAYNKKYQNVWAKEENIQAIAEYIVNYKHPQIPVSGLCHGVRQGHEVIWFNKYLPECNMVGTDIGAGSKEPVILHHDFNIVNPDFIGHFDFVYSNSFDHAFLPAKTFNTWCDQLRKTGLIILEYDRRQEHTGEISQKYNKTDPVSITVGELIQNIPRWNKNASVIDVLNMPVVTQQWRKAIIIEVRN